MPRKKTPLTVAVVEWIGEASGETHSSAGILFKQDGMFALCQTVTHVRGGIEPDVPPFLIHPSRVVAVTRLSPLRKSRK